MENNNFKHLSVSGDLNTGLSYEFKNELGSRLFGVLPDVLPSMQLRYVSGKYYSNKHIDGRTSSDMACTIYENNPFYVRDWADSRRSIDLIQAVIDIEGKEDNFLDALKYLCRCAAMDLPKFSSEQEAYFGRCDRFKTAAKAFHDALTTDRSKEAKAVRDYLTKTGDFKESGRGWSKVDIANSLLGYVSKDSMRLLFTDDELTQLSARDKQIGSKFTLAIPILTGGRVTGMKFRNIFSTDKKDRYHALQGSTKVGLSYIPERGVTDTVIVVEGDMDAVHHVAMWKQAGYKEGDAEIYPVVSTSGNGLTRGMIEDAVRRGIYNFILALDADEKGLEFTLNSARDISDLGGTALVLQYPDGYKDLDEMYCSYFVGEDGKRHHSYTPNDVQRWAKGAINFGYWQGHRLMSEIGGKDAAKEETTFREIRQAIRAIPIFERKVVAQALEREFGIPFSVLLKEDKKAQNKKLSEAFGRVADYYSLGNTKEAERALKQLRRATTDAEDIEATTFAEQSNQAFDTETPEMESLAMPYTLRSKKGGKGQPIKLQAGGITVVGARSGHGKTMFMLNLLVHSLEATKDGGTVVYFMAECSRRTIRDRLCQIYAAVKAATEADALRDIDSYLRSGRLMMFADKSADTVCERIRLIHEKTKVKAAFIDYVQLLRPNKECSNKKERMEENCSQMEMVAKETSIAVVMGAQLNRTDTKDPITLSSDAIGDAIDIEQIASQIFLLWNSDTKCDSYDRINVELQNMGLDITLGVPGRLFVKCTKTRSAEMKKGSVGVFQTDDEQGAVTVLQPKTASTTKEFKKIGR